MTVEDGGQRVQTDKERLLELLASFRIVPALERFTWAKVEDAEHVVLRAKQGGVQGYSHFHCQFTFHPDGSFYEVGVWE